MGSAVDLLHSLFFQLPLGQHLSALARIDPVTAVVVPTLGGVALAIAYHFLARGGRGARSTRSRPMRCMAAGCRSSGA